MSAVTTLPVPVAMPTPSHTDEELLLRYRRTREPEMFAALVRRYERELYNYLRRYLNDPELAEDAFQQAFLQVHLRCETFEEGRRFRPWLYTVATNMAIDLQRRNRRHRMVSLDRAAQGAQGEETGRLVDLLASLEPEPLDHVSRMERGEWVQQALDGLPDSMRTVVDLVYFQGLKYREAAEILNVPVGTVKSRLHAAVLRLNESWNQAHVEP